MTLADHVGTGEPVEVALTTLRYGPKVRSERVDLDHVNALAEVIDLTPPVTVRFPSMQVIDGHHRQAAANRAGRKTIRAVLVSLTDAEAFEAAVRSNVAHGLALTVDERKRHAAKMVKDSPEWSDRRIAETCGLSNKTVAGLRTRRPVKRDRPTEDAPQLDTPTEPERRVGQDGKQRPIDPAKQRDIIAAAVAAKPDASDRSIAKEVGASPSTVGRLRAVPTPAPEPEPERTEVTFGDVMTFMPVEWAADKAITTNEQREFGRFMDRFTHWHGKHFQEWTHLTANCPAELRPAAALAARIIAARWSAMAADLANPNRMEAAK